MQPHTLVAAFTRCVATPAEGLQETRLRLVAATTATCPKQLGSTCNMHGPTFLRHLDTACNAGTAVLHTTTRGLPARAHPAMLIISLPFPRPARLCMQVGPIPRGISGKSKTRKAHKTTRKQKKSVASALLLTSCGFAKLE